MDQIRSPNRHFRKNSPFNGKQAAFILSKYEEFKSIKEVQRAFRKEFYPKKPRQVPNILAFTRILKRFKEESALRPRVPAGRSSEPLRNNIDAVKKNFEQNPKCHIREAARVLGLSYGSIWRILRKNLKWKAYRPHLTQCLSPANMESRLAACTFWLTFEDDWFQRVIWSDEKWFVLKQSPNKQICRYWAPSNPHTVIECKKAHGEKVMAWVGIVDGRILPVVWFQGSVNSNVYLEQVLKNTVWQSVKNLATRRQYWFQHDGASCHVTAECLDFLHAKFGERIISRRTIHHWPPYSPDLSPLDFSFWSQAMAHIIRCEPSTLTELKNIVEDFAADMREEDIRKMVQHTKKRAELCKDNFGGHFEHLLKKT